MLQNVAYRSAVLPEVYPQLPHGPDDGHQALDGVAEHHGLVLQALLLTVTGLVYNLHLLHNCALARLSPPPSPSIKCNSHSYHNATKLSGSVARSLLDCYSNASGRIERYLATRMPSLLRTVQSPPPLPPIPHPPTK